MHPIIALVCSLTPCSYLVVLVHRATRFLLMLKYMIYIKLTGEVVHTNTHLLRISIVFHGHQFGQCKNTKMETEFQAFNENFDSKTPHNSHKMQPPHTATPTQCNPYTTPTLCNTHSPQLSHSITPTHCKLRILQPQ